MIWDCKLVCNFLWYVFDWFSRFNPTSQHAFACGCLWNLGRVICVYFVILLQPRNTTVFPAINTCYLSLLLVPKHVHTYIHMQITSWPAFFLDWDGKFCTNFHRSWSWVGCAVVRKDGSMSAQAMHLSRLCVENLSPFLVISSLVELAKDYNGFIQAIQAARLLGMKVKDVK